MKLLNILTLRIYTLIKYRKFADKAIRVVLVLY